MPKHQRISIKWMTLFLAGMTAGCGFQTYQPKPLQPEKLASNYLAHDPNSPAFREFLITSGYPEAQIPIQHWGLRELTLSALYFHPQLNVARAQWRAAVAGEISAGQRPIPGISGDLEKHSNTDGGVSPWTYGLSIDIPVETAGKRQARIDRAVNLSEAARIDIAQTAWQVRSRLFNSLIDYQNSAALTEILQKEVDLRGEIVAMLQARLDAGMISSIELSNARLLLLKAQQALSTEQNNLPALKVALASNAGLSLETFNQLTLDSIAINDHALVFDAQTNADMQQTALLNRLDIRGALARYAAAEAKLRLEISKQYPDITLSPGYSYDQGDNIWSLGLNTLLTFINKNKGLIEESRALREVEAAQFEALQANVLTNLAQAKAFYQAAYTTLNQAEKLQKDSEARTTQIQKQFDSGYADRLEFATSKLENLLATQNIINVEYTSLRATAVLEDVLQKPISDTSTVPDNIETLTQKPTTPNTP
jgi:outer membrane protein TolC